MLLTSHSSLTPSRRFRLALVLLLIVSVLGICALTWAHLHAHVARADSPWVYLGNTGGQTVQIDNVGSGTFNPNKLSVWHADATDPLLAAAANSTGNPNIYAAQTQWDATNNRWDVFYGGWDGDAASHDHIYETTTTDWTNFTAYQTIISPGSYIHANNPSVIQNAPGSPWRMVYTSYPDDGSLNKPHYSTSADGTTWTPDTTSSSNALTISGYPSGADINGGNVLYYENGTYSLYFIDFNNSGGSCANRSAVCLATSTDGVNFTYQGVAESEANHIVNDMKAFSYNGTSYYLMGMQENGNNLYASVSTSLTSFPTSTAFFNRPNYFMTSLGWIANNNRLYGALYGATTCGCLSTNAISAVWLQDQVNFTSTDGTVSLTTDQARGPDTVLLSMNGQSSVTGSFSLYDTDGTTLLSTSSQITLHPGDHWSYGTSNGSVTPMAIASSQHASFPASAAIDGNTDTFWSSNQDGSSNSEEYIGVNFGTPQQLTGVSVVPRLYNGSALGFPADFSFQTSQNGNGWSTISGQAYTNFANPSQPLQFTFSAPVTTQYLRMDATSLGTDNYGNYYFQLAELSPEFAPAGATASSQAASWSGASQAIDGNSGTFWSSGGHNSSNASEWLSVDLGSVQSVRGIQLIPRTIGTTVYAFPTAFIIQTSSDGSNWATLSGQSYTNYPTPSSSGVAFFFSAVSTRYVRILATALSQDDYGFYYFQVAEAAVFAA